MPNAPRRFRVRANDITDIEPVRELTGLVKFSCAGNPVSDYSPVSGLINLEELQIEEVSVLGNLDKLTYLDLELNQIKDITPLYGLNRLEHISLERNGISEDELALFFEEKRGKLFTVTQTGRLREDMPEFTFDLSAYFDLERGTYALQSLDVMEGDTLGFELEDVNFDGYQDICLFDTSNGNYRQEWIYLVWNPKEEQFEHDVRLNAISLASFDQENKLIYGMERGAADRHYYSTYQYIGGEPVKIRYVEEEYVFYPQKSEGK